MIAFLCCTVRSNFRHSLDRRPLVVHVDMGFHLEKLQTPIRNWTVSKPTPRPPRLSKRKAFPLPRVPKVGVLSNWRRKPRGLRRGDGQRCKWRAHCNITHFSSSLLSSPCHSQVTTFTTARMSSATASHIGTELDLDRTPLPCVHGSIFFRLIQVWMEKRQTNLGLETPTVYHSSGIVSV